MPVQESPLDRQDHIRFRQVIVRLEALRVVAGEGGVLEPAGPGKAVEQPVEACPHRGRCGGFSQERQPGAAHRGQAPVLLPPGGFELRPGGGPSLVQGGLGSIRIVKGQDCRLRHRVSGAPAFGVAGIAFDLGRPAFMRLDQDPPGKSLAGAGGSVERRQARHDRIRLVGIGHERLGRAAPGQAAQGQRRSHQAEEAPPIEVGRPNIGALGKLRGTRRQ